MCHDLTIRSLSPTRPCPPGYRPVSIDATEVGVSGAWALAYNLSVLPLAAAGQIAPWAAAAGMSLSSLLVTVNALRLNRIRTSEGSRP